MIRIAYRDIQKKRDNEFQIPQMGGKFENLREFGRHLDKQEKPLQVVVRNEVHPIRTVLLPAADDGASVLWYDETLIDKIKEGSIVFIDGTFNCRPRGLGLDPKRSQFLTFMTYINGQVSDV